MKKNIKKKTSEVYSRWVTRQRAWLLHKTLVTCAAAAAAAAADAAAAAAAAFLRIKCNKQLY